MHHILVLIESILYQFWRTNKLEKMKVGSEKSWIITKNLIAKKGKARWAKIQKKLASYLILIFLAGLQAVQWWVLLINYILVINCEY